MEDSRKVVLSERVIFIKLNRLLEITTILLNKKTVTAAELAERFNVSTRTIYRDIDALSASGVPVYALQGANGGISLLDDYTVSRTTLTSNEKDSILFALQALQSTKYPEVSAVLEKLGSIFHNTAIDWISIDFTPWGSNPNAYHKFSDIKAAVLQSRIIAFDYINARNEKSHRQIEPLRLIFKAHSWYLWGFCLTRQDFRTFRISRIKNLEITDEPFERGRARIPSENPPQPEKECGMVHLVLEFTEEAKVRLYDDYDDDRIHDNGNGTYRMELDFPEDEWVYGYIQSFGPFVRVIEPEHIRNIIRERSEKVLSYYAR